MKTDSTGTTSYAWDFENRLTSVRRSSDTAIPIWETELSEKRGAGNDYCRTVLQSPKLTNHVIVRIGRPQKTESGDFITPYQIVGVDDDKVRFAAGLDAVQSLQLVLQMIGADVHYGLKEYQLRWAYGDDPGFPAP